MKPEDVQLDVEGLARKTAKQLAMLVTASHEGCKTIGILRANIERIGTEAIAEALLRRVSGKGATAKLVYRVPQVGLTIGCSTCSSRILYGAMPIFCSVCGSKFTDFDDEGATEKVHPLATTQGTPEGAK